MLLQLAGEIERVLSSVRRKGQWVRGAILRDRAVVEHSGESALLEDGEAIEAVVGDEADANTDARSQGPSPEAAPPRATAKPSPRPFALAPSAPTL